MKRPALFGGAIIAIILGIFFVFSGGNDSGGRPPTPTPPLTAMVIVIAPDVSVKQPGDSDFVVVKRETEVRVNTEIKTSATGKARIFYPNGTITNVENSSHVKVQKLDSSGGQSRLQLISGSVWAKLKNILGKGEFYEIETDNVVANVRGTIFGIQYRDGATRVIGIQHSVRVDGWDPVSQRAITQIGVQVDSREKLTVRGPVASRSAVFRTEFIVPDDLRDEEIKRNIIDLLEPLEAQDPMIRELIEETKELNLQDTELIREIELKGLLATPTSSPSIRIDTTVGDLKIEVRGLPNATATP